MVDITWFSELYCDSSKITIFRVMQLETILQNALFEEKRACDGKISRNGILINREKYIQYTMTEKLQPL